MAGLVIGSDTFSATLDDGFRQAIERAVREAAPRTMRAIEREGERLFREGQADWPVKKRNSNDSRGKLYYNVRLTPPDSIELVFGNRSPYAYYIRGNRQGGRHTWTELFRKPVRSRKFQDRLADELADELTGAL